MPQGTLSKVGRHNTSLSVVIPAHMARASNIERGDDLLITMPEVGVIVIAKVDLAAKLQELKY